MSRREDFNRSEVERLMGKTFRQSSIERTRAMISEAVRLAGVMFKQIRSQKQRANVELEMLLDDVAAESGLAMTKENLPTLGLYVRRYLEDVAQANEKRRTDASLLDGFEGEFSGLPGDDDIRKALEKRQAERRTAGQGPSKLERV